MVAAGSWGSERPVPRSLTVTSRLKINVGTQAADRGMPGDSRTGCKLAPHGRPRAYKEGSRWYTVEARRDHWNMRHHHRWRSGNDGEAGTQTGAACGETFAPILGWGVGVAPQLDGADLWRTLTPRTPRLEPSFIERGSRCSATNG